MSTLPTIDRDALAYALKRRLRDSGLNYNQAAEMAGVNRGHIISCIERRDIRSGAFVRIMSFLKEDLLEDNIEIINCHE